MLNVERIPAAPIGMKNNVRLDLDEYLYSVSPPRFSIANIKATSHLDYHPAEFLNGFTSIHDSPSKTDSFTETSEDEELPKSEVETKSNTTLSAPSTCLQECPQREKSLKSQKRVLFADDIGKQLVEIRIISDVTTNQPLNCTFKRQSKLTRGTTIYGSFTLFDICPSLKNSLPKLNIRSLIFYYPQFAQPASNYSSVTDRLEKNCLSLEHANITDENNNRVLTLSGKVLVKNLGFEKLVLVRSTCDKWKSFTDIESKFVKGFVNGRHDTFVFSIELSKLNPLAQSKQINSSISDKYPESVEFAVCYKCLPHQEFWDNNYGCNYIFSQQHT